MVRDETINKMISNIYQAPNDIVHQLKRYVGKSYNSVPMKVKMAFITVCPNLNYMTNIEKDIMFFSACTASLQNTIGKRENGSTLFPSYMAYTYLNTKTSDSEKCRIRNFLNQNILNNGVFLARLSNYVKRGIQKENRKFNIYILTKDLLNWNRNDAVKNKWVSELTHVVFNDENDDKNEGENKND